MGTPDSGGSALLAPLSSHTTIRTGRDGSFVRKPDATRAGRQFESQPDQTLTLRNPATHSTDTQSGRSGRACLCLSVQQLHGRDRSRRKPRTKVSAATSTLAALSRFQSRSHVVSPVYASGHRPVLPGARPHRSGLCVAVGLVWRSDSPAPTWHRSVRDGLGLGLRVVHRQARAPLRVTHDRGAELRVGGKAHIVGSG